MILEEGRLALGWIVPEGKTWVDVFQALLTPTIALSALGLGVLNYQLSLLKRRDDLWRRRYDFYNELYRWKSGFAGEEPDAESAREFARRASFLFGDDVVQLIVKVGRRHSQPLPIDPDPEFEKVFAKYLTYRECPP